MPFKMHKILFLPEKNYQNKYVSLPYLKFSDTLRKIHTFFLFGGVFMGKLQFVKPGLHVFFIVNINMFCGTRKNNMQWYPCFFNFL